MPLLLRVDPTLHMNRWYHVTVQSGLFDLCIVACAWGNRNTGYQRVRQIPVADPEQGQRLAEKIIRRKLRRGYRLEETLAQKSVSKEAE